MPRRVLLQRSHESFDLVEVQAPNEHSLQEVIKTNPQLIPSDDLGLDGDLLVVGRETTLASGAIDLLCLAKSGDLVLVEFKTGPQNPDFRHALAQVIDYGSDLWRLSVEDFDRGVVQRYLAGSHVESGYAAASDLHGAIALTNWNLVDDERASLDARLADVLATGDFIYVVAAQRFTPAMTTSLEYLNTTMRYGRFYLVELVQLQGHDLTAHAAQVVAAPLKKAASGGATATSQANEADFLAAIGSEPYRDAMKAVLSACAALGLVVDWKTKGASIRIPTPDRKEPLSIAWLLPEGHHSQGARHLTLGVDHASLAQTPSVGAAVLAYVEQVKVIPGAKPVSGKLDGYMFAPAVVPGIKEAIVESLDALVETVQSTSGGSA